MTKPISLRWPTAFAVAAALTLPSLQALAQAHAAKPQNKAKTGAEVLAESPDSDWRALDPENTLLMDLPQGQVLIELAPRFAPAHVANIRALARGGFFEGLAIVRVQDNFVAQWGDPAGDDAAKAKPLSAGAKPRLPAEFSIPLSRIPKAEFARLPDRDGWATLTGFVDGFPVAADPIKGQAWLAHCYGTVGAGRGDAPDSSTGAELYAVIGQAPRGLDLNITTVGRVLKGMELLASLPRGGANMGFYDKPEQQLGIRGLRLLTQVPEAERPALQVLRTDSKTWPLWLETRRQRSGWFVHNPQHVDLCGVSAPLRASKTSSPRA